MWPPPGFLVVNPTILELALHEFRTEPGGATLALMTEGLRDQFKHALSNPASQAFVLAPLGCREAGHWTLLYLHRAAQAPGQESPNKFASAYLDSLREPSLACKKMGAEALAFLINTLGHENVELNELPPASPCAKQSDSVSCGWYVVAFMEELYRQYRGEGRSRLSLTQPALRAMVDRTNKFIKICLAVSHAEQRKAVAMANAEANAVAKTSPKALLGSLGLPPTGLPPPGPPGEPAACPIYGCSRCRNSKDGCLSCCPAKHLRWAKAQI